MNVTIDHKYKKVVVNTPVEFGKLSAYLEKTIGKGYKKFRIVSKRSEPTFNYFPQEPKFGYISEQ